MKLLKKYYRLFVVILLILMLILEITSAIQESQTVDEGVHLSAGYSYLMKNDFRMNIEHPPFIKELAALPLVIINNKLDQPFDKTSWSENAQWQFAKDLIYDNNISADTILLLGRIPIMLLSLVLGFFVFRWTRELFGIPSAIFSLILYVFSPNILAHSRYVTTDLAVSLFFFLNIYYFYKYLKSPSYKNFLIFALVFGLAQVTKFSALLLIPILIVFLLILQIPKHLRPIINQATKFYGKKIILLTVITSIIIFSAYGFELKKPLEDIQIQHLYYQQEQIISNNEIDQQNNLVKRIINFTDTRRQSGQTIKNILQNINVPAFPYIAGAVKLFFHNYNGHTSYLMGQYSDYGWWYYFPVAFLVKTPISTIIMLLILLITAVFFLFKKPINTKDISISTNIIKRVPFHFYFLIIPPLLYFIFSLASNINLGLRHVLIVYPFIFVLLGWLLTRKFKIGQKIYYLLLSSLLILYILSSALIYPHYLAYFNELSGGPGQGSKYLVDSNIDWGQDVKKLKKYMNKNSIKYVCFSYFGQAKLEYYDIDFRYLPDTNNFKGTDKLDCVVAVSVTSLYSREREYSWLLQYEPDAKIGYSIYLYDFRKK